MIVSLEEKGTNAYNHYTMCPVGQFRVNFWDFMFLHYFDYFDYAWFFFYRDSYYDFFNLTFLIIGSYIVFISILVFISVQASIVFISIPAWISTQWQRSWKSIQSRVPYLKRYHWIQFSKTKNSRRKGEALDATIADKYWKMERATEGIVLLSKGHMLEGTKTIFHW